MHTEQVISNGLLPTGNKYNGPASDKIDAEHEANLKTVIEICRMTQTMIDGNIVALNSLRYEYPISKQQEIRALENKLVRQFGQQIISRKQFPDWKAIDELRAYPSMSQWLEAVGLDNRCKKMLLQQYNDIDQLMEASDEELRQLIMDAFLLDNVDTLDDSDEENLPVHEKGDIESKIRAGIVAYVKEYAKRLLKAQRSLHTCVDAAMNDTQLPLDVELHWDSWPRWPSKVDASLVDLISKAIAEISSKSVRSVPKPLPPLPSISRTRLVNFRSENSSRSTGSSPLSPPGLPLSACGNNSHRSVLSSSCLSSVILPSGFGNNGSVDAGGHSTPMGIFRATPPPTPPVAHHKRSFMLTSSSLFSSSRNSDRKFPTTPPPIRRHQANLFSSDQFPLTKSKSHEEHLSRRIEPLDPVIANKFLKKYNLGLFSSKSKSNNSNKQHNSLDNLPHVPHQQRRRLATEPGSIGSTSPVLTSSDCSSPVAVSPDNQSQVAQPNSGDIFLDNSVIPRSPRSTGMLHSIHHRFTSTMKISSTCNVCDKTMFIGYKCRDCKYYCHWDCMEKAPNSCGLPSEFFDVFKQTMSDIENRSASPSVAHRNLSSLSFSHRARSQIGNYGPSAASSHSVSNPSSPALFNHNSSSSSAAISPTGSSSKDGSQFQFPPDINVTCISSSISLDNCDSNLILDTRPFLEDATISLQSNFSTIQEEHEEHEESTIMSLSLSCVDSDKSANSLVTTSGSSDSDGTRTVTGHSARFDSQDSQVSDTDQAEQSWPRQNSLTLREWDIPYDELVLEEEIGPGRFGTVYRGNWHGSVAIKRLNMGNNVNQDRKAIDSFKQEVAIFRKTRHDNLVLFMGACMKPPHLAIVTSLCKGLTLHTHIHDRHDKFNLNRIIMIAEQICLGMGYLHAREIIHKDLKTKNIFYENGKVIITDFGLSSAAKLCITKERDNNRCADDKLFAPKNWLCYLAPEIMRSLRINSLESDDLPFSFSTDIYAFGTVFFELLFGNWPFADLHTETIIWQVGKGIKQPFSNLQASKDIKDLLSICWAFNPKKRPDFGKTLYEALQKLPKKRLQRSPSHPTHLQHTSEQRF